MEQRVNGEFVEYGQEFFHKPVTRPSRRLSYHAAISITSFSALGREKTCQFIASFVIEDVPLVFPRAKKMWDSSDGRPNEIPPESRQSRTMEAHPTRSRAEREADVLRT
ncbi:MAG TPA: hypothetical protein VN644_10250 [Pyrinomonadaceae bacterium]|nr:hypothetical protein [Pyrinomonadaceae bacterium]